MNDPTNDPEHVSGRGVVVLVTHSSPVVAHGLLRILRDRLAGVRVVADLAEVSVGLTTECLMVGDEGEMRSLQRRVGRDRGAPHVARLLIGSTCAASRLEGPAARVLPLDCDEDELVSAIGRALEVMNRRSDHAKETGGRERGLAPGRRRRVETYIEAHLAEPIDVAALAREAGMSDCHFARAFRKSFGLPPHRYLVRRRIQVAARLARETLLPLIEVGLEVGFCDQSHFTRTFVEQVGETPRAFRARHRPPERGAKVVIGSGVARERRISPDEADRNAACAT